MNDVCIVQQNILISRVILESLNRLIEEEKLLVEHHKKSSDRGKN
jgi:hypothetical protein